MKKRLFLALISLLFPIVAGATTPTPGHYEGLSDDSKPVSFYLTHDGRIHNIQLGGHYATDLFPTHVDKHHRFQFDDITGRKERLSAHGVWNHDQTCRGDFRFYPSRDSERNQYHIWHAHWVNH